MNIRNQVQLIGHVGNAPEIISFGENKVMAKFSIATRDNYKDTKGNWVKNTHWHNVIAWNGSAKTAEKLLDKGTEIAMNGKLTSRSWEDQNGKTQYVTEIVLNDFTLLGKKKEN